MKLDGANTRARVLLAWMYVNGNRLPEALALVDAGLEHDPNSYGLLRLKLDCLRKLGRPWHEIKLAIGKYLNVAEEDFEERLNFIKGLVEATDIAHAKRQLDYLKKADLGYNMRIRTEHDLMANGTPMVVEGTYLASGLGKGFVQIDGYPNGMGAYLDLRNLTGGAKLFNGKRLRISLSVNGFGLRVKQVLA
ncbi:MAG: hypothetical protein WBQ69_07660 [Gallionella sp.]